MQVVGGISPGNRDEMPPVRERAVRMRPSPTAWPRGNRGSWEEPWLACANSGHGLRSLRIEAWRPTEEEPVSLGPAKTALGPPGKWGPCPGG